ncbi:MAG: gamma-glutamyltransferase family protein [Rubricoccaceae bacterium]
MRPLTFSLALMLGFGPGPLAAQDAARTAPPPAEASGPGDRYFPPRQAMRSATVAPNAMAATSHPLATQVALEVLREGGSAVDAAIAANAVIGFLEPTGNGIGGDLFALVWDPRADGGQGRLFGLNASGRAPRGVPLEAVRAAHPEGEIPFLSGHSVTVPGAVDGWYALHGRFGRLPMPRLLAPAIGYAEDGAPVPSYIAALWARAPRLARQPGFADVFLPGGRAPREGERFRNPALARTLRRVAEGGSDAFYRGEIAREIEAFCAEAGCYLTAEDLAAHTHDWVEPLGVTVEGYTLWQLPPNGQGLATLQLLGLAAGFDLRAMGHNSADYLHHLIEAKKVVYEDRARFYADPAFMDVDPAALIAPEYLAARRALIDPARASDAFEPGDVRAGRGGTITLAVGDADGMMISLIQSNYAGFGSGFTPPALGFSFQNRGAGFALEPGHPNAYAPGKRPFHTIIPGFVTREGRPYMAYGVMGGDVQPQGQVQVFLNHVLFGMDIQAAGDVARWRHAGSTEPSSPGRRMTDGGCVSLESGIPASVREALAARGHRLCEEAFTHFGGYQAVRWDAENRVYWGATESRVDGSAAGF